MARKSQCVISAKRSASSVDPLASLVSKRGYDCPGSSGIMGTPVIRCSSPSASSRPLRGGPARNSLPTGGPTGQSLRGGPTGNSREPDAGGPNRSPGSKNRSLRSGRAGTTHEPDAGDLNSSPGCTDWSLRGGLTGNSREPDAVSPNMSPGNKYRYLRNGPAGTTPEPDAGNANGSPGTTHRSLRGGPIGNIREPDAGNPNRSPGSKYRFFRGAPAGTILKRAAGSPRMSSSGTDRSLRCATSRTELKLELVSGPPHDPSENSRGNPVDARSPRCASARALAEPCQSSRLRPRDTTCQGDSKAGSPPAASPNPPGILRQPRALENNRRPITQLGAAKKHNGSTSLVQLTSPRAVGRPLLKHAASRSANDLLPSQCTARKAALELQSEVTPAVAHDYLAAQPRELHGDAGRNRWECSAERGESDEQRVHLVKQIHDVKDLLIAAKEAGQALVNGATQCSQFQPSCGLTIPHGQAREQTPEQVVAVLLEQLGHLDNKLDIPRQKQSSEPMMGCVGTTEASELQRDQISLASPVPPCCDKAEVPGAALAATERVITTEQKGVLVYDDSDSSSTSCGSVVHGSAVCDSDVESLKTSDEVIDPALKAKASAIGSSTLVRKALSNSGLTTPDIRCTSVGEVGTAHSNASTPVDTTFTFNPTMFRKDPFSLSRNPSFSDTSSDADFTVLPCDSIAESAASILMQRSPDVGEACLEDGEREVSDSGRPSHVSTAKLGSEPRSPLADQRRSEVIWPAQAEVELCTRESTVRPSTEHPVSSYTTTNKNAVHDTTRLPFVQDGSKDDNSVRPVTMKHDFCSQNAGAASRGKSRSKAADPHELCGRRLQALRRARNPNGWFSTVVGED